MSQRAVSTRVGRQGVSILPDKVNREIESDVSRSQEHSKDMQPQRKQSNKNQCTVKIKYSGFFNICLHLVQKTRLFVDSFPGPQ